MSFLFKRNPKTPQDIVRALNEQIQKLDASGDSRTKAQDDCSRYLKQIKVILHGDDETDPQPDQILQLAQEIYVLDCLFHLVVNLRRLDFDSRKDVLIVFSTLLRRQIGSKSPTVDYLLHQKPEVILMILKGPEHEEVGLICGQILRDCIKFESIAQFILGSPQFWNFFKYVQIPTFEIATDAFSTLHDLLTTHLKLALDFLAKNYDVFNLHITQLIRSDNYVTKRQSVRLLLELVLQKQNQVFLNKFFDDTANLKLVMLLLSDKSKNLQLEGFHIFKFFVAKPRKSPKIQDILIKNKDNFLAFFDNFDVRPNRDATLLDEREYILAEIRKLPELGTHP